VANKQLSEAQREGRLSLSFPTKQVNNPNSSSFNKNNYENIKKNVFVESHEAEFPSHRAERSWQDVAEEGIYLTEQSV